MKKLISPKDFLFFSMLLLIVAIGYFGFYQSSKFKTQENNRTSVLQKISYQK